MSKWVERNVVSAPLKDGRILKFEKPLSVWEAMARVRDAK